MTGTRAYTAGAIAAASFLLAAACGGDSPESGDVVAVAPEGYSATPQYLGQVAEQSGAESFRYEMWMTAGDSEPTGDPGFRGAIQGEQIASETDSQAMFEAMNASLAEKLGPQGSLPPSEASNFSMESVNEGELLHLRMPFLLEAPDDLLDPESRELRDLVAETDGWMTIHPSQMLGTSPEELKQAFGGDPASQDPAAMINVIAEAKDASELGASQVRGEDVVGIQAEIGFTDLIGGVGTDSDDFMDLFMDPMLQGIGEAEGLTPAEIDQFSDVLTTVMAEMTLSSEVWVDEDGYVRRFTFAMDLDQLLVDLAEEMGEEPPPPGAMGAPVRITTDFFDYGEDMDITVPADTVDLTDRPELFDYWALVQFAKAM